MKHFVVNDVLDGASGNSGMIKDPAHHNRVVRGIIVTQAIARMLAAPSHLRSRQKSMKELRIQVFEDSFEVIGVSLGRSDPLPSANLPDKMGLARHMLRRNISPVASGVVAIDRLAVHLCQ